MSTGLLTLAECSARIASGELTSTALVEECLERIGRINPALNAFITVCADGALAQARVLDAERKAGHVRSPLHGIPVALKDNIDTAGVRTTAASLVLHERVPAEDAEVSRRLNDAGAVLMGKTNMQEFALGSTSTVSYFGPVRNPWDTNRNPGGSSGGSAAAVAAGLCYGALGTDTGGSIRTPASFCGIVGLKPTYGLVSLRGIIPAKLSLDHCGPMARTVEDAALLLGALAGYDRLDIASVEHAVEDYAAASLAPVKGLRVGVPRIPFFDLLAPEIVPVIRTAVELIQDLTGPLRDVVLPAVGHISLAGETYAWHEAHYGRGAGRYQIHSRKAIEADRNAAVGAYVRSREEMALLRRTIDDSFRDVDVVVLPTRRRLPDTIADSLVKEESDKPSNPEHENTGAFNIYGIPAVSVPCGFTETGLPVGITIAGPRFSEGRILALARAYEKAAGWSGSRGRSPALR